MRPSESSFRNRTSDTEKIGSTASRDFFNRIGHQRTLTPYDFDTSSPGPMPLTYQRLRGSEILYLTTLQAFQAALDAAVAMSRRGTSR